jgi:hypothetical protein
MTKEIINEEFIKYVLEGKTIPELQNIYDNCSRSKIVRIKKDLDLIGKSPNGRKIDRDLGEKECTACNITFPLANFYSNGKTPRGTQKYKSKCISCENHERKDSFIDLIFDYLTSKDSVYACIKCGFYGEYGSLDFHHRNPSLKLFNIGRTSLTYSKESFYATVVPEIEKCDLLCPNCHRQEHLLMGWK